MESLERLLEEHSQAVALYPKRAGELELEIRALLESAPWRADIPQGDQSIPGAANFLCELKESQIRSGLHVFGRAPAGACAVDFVMSLLRFSSGTRAGLFDALSGGAVELEQMSAAARDALHERARTWVEGLFDAPKADLFESAELASLRSFAVRSVLPLLERTREEMEHLLDGLAGRFVPPGPAGAPTRGRIDVLPTGRNFYALDPRVVPTPTAWRCGRLLGESLLKRYFQDHGEPLRTLALVVWGTSNMRTGGDDLAQAIWLWGCEPVWEEGSGRIVDFKILPASVLGRPRVDVTLRVSGLFRDAFGDTVRLLAAIPKRLALL
ncbi:MAG: cobaltochelatase subunit CobN, partial [Verrucomicrobia bacterium]|nr:cobaltochelatase subunit CobN [Verrucomicrobiota bacterium]